MTHKGRKTRSTSKSSQLAKDKTLLSFAIPKEWKTKLEALCGDGKRFETPSALMRHLVSEFLRASEPEPPPNPARKLNPTKAERRPAIGEQLPDPSESKRIQEFGVGGNAPDISDS